MIPTPWDKEIRGLKKLVEPTAWQYTYLGALQRDAKAYRRGWRDALKQHNGKDILRMCECGHTILAHSIFNDDKCDRCGCVKYKYADAVKQEEYDRLAGIALRLAGVSKEELMRYILTRLGERR